MVCRLTGVRPLSGQMRDYCWLNPLGPNFNESHLEMQQFSRKKMRLKMSSAKRWPRCLGLNVLLCYVKMACNCVVIMSQIAVTTHELRCVSNHWQLGCLFNSFLRLLSKKTTKFHIILILCEWKLPVTGGGSPHKGPVMRKVCPYHDVIMKLLRALLPVESGRAQQGQMQTWCNVVRVIVVDCSEWGAVKTVA